MEQLVGHFVELFSTHFDLSFMLCVNVLTYILIKVIDDINGDKSVGTWTKRLVMLISCFAIATGYIAGGYENTTILINSAILAPVAWSWIFKPILKRLVLIIRKLIKLLKLIKLWQKELAAVVRLALNLVMLRKLRKVLKRNKTLWQTLSTKCSY